MQELPFYFGDEKLIKYRTATHLSRTFTTVPEGTTAQIFSPHLLFNAPIILKNQYNLRLDAFLVVFNATKAPTRRVRNRAKAAILKTELSACTNKGKRNASARDKEHKLLRLSPSLHI